MTSMSKHSAAARRDFHDHSPIPIRDRRRLAVVPPTRDKSSWESFMMHARSVVFKIRRSFLPEILSAVVGLVLLGSGTSFFLSPETYQRAASFQVAITWMHTDGWGISMMLAGFLLLLSALLQEKLGLMAMSLTACLVLTVFALALTVAAIGPGVPSAAWIWIGFAALTAFNTIIFAVEMVEDRT